MKSNGKLRYIIYCSFCIQNIFVVFVKLDIMEWENMINDRTFY